MNGSDGTAGLEKQDFMKDLFKFGRLLVAAAVLTCAAGCSDDKDGSGGGPELPDPEGTVLKSLQNENNGKTRLDIGNGDGYLYIDAANNFYGWRASVCCVGKVDGLASITFIPENGWGNTAAMPGYGYVGMAPNPYLGGKDYIRIYVVDYIRSAGEIIGVVVKYQAPFTPES